MHSMSQEKHQVQETHSEQKHYMMINMLSTNKEKQKPREETKLEERNQYQELQEEQDKWREIAEPRKLAK